MARTAARRRRSGDGHGRCGVVTCGRRPIRKFQQKSPRRSSPGGLQMFCDDAAMPLICPTCQIFFEGVNKLRKMRRNWFDNLKRSLPIEIRQTKSPLPISRRGLYDIGDDVGVPLICPTRQVGGEFWFGARTFGRNEVFWRLAAEPTARRIARRPSMYFAAAVLAVLSGLFYAAGHHEIGS